MTKACYSVNLPLKIFENSVMKLDYIKLKNMSCLFLNLKTLQSPLISSPGPPSKQNSFSRYRFWQSGKPSLKRCKSFRRRFRLDPSHVGSSHFSFNRSLPSL